MDSLAYDLEHHVKSAQFGCDWHLQYLCIREDNQRFLKAASIKPNDSHTIIFYTTIHYNSELWVTLAAFFLAISIAPSLSEASRAESERRGGGGSGHDDRGANKVEDRERGGTKQSTRPKMKHCHPSRARALTMGAVNSKGRDNWRVFHHFK